MRRGRCGSGLRSGRLRGLGLRREDAHAVAGLGLLHHRDDFLYRKDPRPIWFRPRGLFRGLDRGLFGPWLKQQSDAVVPVPARVPVRASVPTPFDAPGRHGLQCLGEHRPGQGHRPILPATPLREGRVKVIRVRAVPPPDQAVRPNERPDVGQADRVRRTIAFFAHQRLLLVDFWLTCSWYRLLCRQGHGPSVRQGRAAARLRQQADAFVPVPAGRPVPVPPEFRNDRA